MTSWWSLGPLLAGLAWGLAPLWSFGVWRRAGDPTAVEEPADDLGGLAGPGPVTVLVRVGDEPWEVTRPAVLLNASGGPTVMVSSRDGVERLRIDGVPIVRRPTIEAAIDAAIDEVVTTPWVLIVSARVVADRAVAEKVAARARPADRWVVARTAPVNRHRRDGTRRDVGEALRRRARRCGLWLWESDAVLVAADLLRAQPFSTGRPFGAWLRARAAEGYGGVRAQQVVSWSCEPAGGPGFWALDIARRRAGVADLFDACSGTRGEHKRLARLLLVRELYGVGVVAVTVPWWATVLGARPPASPTTMVVVVALAAAWRYLRMRRALGVYPRWMADVWALVAGIPGSLLSIAALRERPLANRAPTPSRPLTWMALGLTLLAGGGLVSQAVEDQPSTASVVFSSLTLAMLWILALRSLAEREPQRGSLRVALDAVVRVGDVATRSLDASVDGLAVIWPRDASIPRRGTVTDVEVDPGSGADPVRLRAQVIAPRHGRVDALGLDLDHRRGVPAEWLDLVRGALATGPSRPRRRRAARTRRDRRPADVVLGWAVGALSAVVLGALVLVVAGFQPLVVRSASMVPTLDVGDVVLVERVPAARIAVGDVVTRPASQRWGESLTHRVRGIDAVGSDLRVTTRGDANADSETWLVGRDDLVGREVATVPVVGRAVVALRATPVRLVLSTMLLATYAIVARRSRRRRRDQVAPVPHAEPVPAR